MLIILIITAKPDSISCKNDPSLTSIKSVRWNTFAQYQSRAQNLAVWPALWSLVALTRFGVR